ncbi:MAG: glycosyltransferase family 9 protein [Cyanobacteria bacterium]|nr:glycosyltransferase family 9 protein [Cyanobacteriota bacterium]
MSLIPSSEDFQNPSVTKTSLKILISRLSAHGDVIQTLPLLSQIKQHFPDSHIGWIVEASAYPLLKNHPLIDTLHVFEKKELLQLFKNPLTWGKAIQKLTYFIRELRKPHYQIGFDVQGLLKSSLLLYLSGTPRRIGYLKTRECGDIFYTETLPHHDLKNPLIPTVALFSEFLNTLPTAHPPLAFSRENFIDPNTHGVFQFQLPEVSPSQKEEVAQLFNSMPPNTSPWVIAIAPATLWTSKHWPVAYWQKVVHHILNMPEPIQLVVLGSPQDEALCHAILQKFATETSLVLNEAENLDPPKVSPPLNLCGKTSLTDLYEVFKRVHIFIGPDSAPLHIANAVGNSLILGLYGPTSPRRTGPIGPQHKTLSTQFSCQPCFKKKCPLQNEPEACMKGISPQEVIDVITEWVKLLPSRFPRMQEHQQAPHEVSS